jgi:hypothetical protein
VCTTTTGHRFALSVLHPESTTNFAGAEGHWRTLEPTGRREERREWRRRADTQVR